MRPMRAYPRTKCPILPASHRSDTPGIRLRALWGVFPVVVRVHSGAFFGKQVVWLKPLRREGTVEHNPVRLVGDSSIVRIGSGPHPPSSGHHPGVAAANARDAYGARVQVTAPALLPLATSTSKSSPALMVTLTVSVTTVSPFAGTVHFAVELAPLTLTVNASVLAVGFGPKQ